MGRYIILFTMGKPLTSTLFFAWKLQSLLAPGDHWMVKLFSPGSKMTMLLTRATCGKSNFKWFRLFRHPKKSDLNCLVNGDAMRCIADYIQFGSENGINGGSSTNIWPFWYEARGLVGALLTNPKEMLAYPNRDEPLLMWPKIAAQSGPNWVCPCLARLCLFSFAIRLLDTAKLRVYSRGKRGTQVKQ